MLTADGSLSDEQIRRSKVLTANIEVQKDIVRVTCTNTSAASFSLELGRDDAIADLETCFFNKLLWPSMEVMSCTGELVNPNTALQDLDQVVLTNYSDSKRYEFWKQTYPIVGKALAAIKADAFDPESNNFQVTWRGKTAREVDPPEFDRLVEETFGLNAQSAITKTHFVQIFGTLLENAECSNMMNLQLLQNFDRFLKTLKHQLYLELLEVALLAVTRPLVMKPFPAVAVFTKNLNGGVIGIDMICDYSPVDRNLENSLNLSDLKLQKPWDKASCKDVARLLRTFETDHGQLDFQPSIEIDPSRDNAIRLANLQLRLSCEVCPVLIDEPLEEDMFAFLAEATEYKGMVLQRTGQFYEFSEQGGHADSLERHAASAVAAASVSGLRGTLFLIRDLPPNGSTILAPFCCHLRDTLSPSKVRFILCDTLSGKASPLDEDRAGFQSAAPPQTINFQADAAYNIKCNIECGLGIDQQTLFLSAVPNKKTPKGRPVGLEKSDAGCGLQSWVLTKGDGDWYNIRVEGGCGHGTLNGGNYLSVSALGSKVDLSAEDDASGRQRWLITKVVHRQDGGAEDDGDWCTIRALGGVMLSRSYLSARAHSIEVELYSHDSSSGKQRWQIPGFDSRRP